MCVPIRARKRSSRDVIARAIVALNVAEVLRVCETRLTRVRRWLQLRVVSVSSAMRSSKGLDVFPDLFVLVALFFWRAETVEGSMSCSLAGKKSQLGDG